MCVHLNILRVISVKTQLILLSIVNVATCFDSQSHHQANVLNHFVFLVPCIADKIYLIVVQRDATQSSLFIILHVHSTSFGCQPYPSSGLHKTVTTATGTGQLPPSNVAKLDNDGGRQLTSTGSCSYSLCIPDDGCG